MKSNLITNIFVVCVFAFITNFAGAVVNIVNFKVKSRYYGDIFDENTGYRKDLTDGKLIDLSDEQSLRVAEMVTDRLLELERMSDQPNTKKEEIDLPTKLELRDIIFNLNRYCLKVQGYQAKDGKMFSYVNGFPMINSLGEVKFKSIPEKIPGFDDGGSQYWQAYIDMESGKVDILFNKSF